MPTESSDLNKISKLENQFHEMHIELKVINSNLTGINDTLKEFKQINRSLSEIKTEQAYYKILVNLEEENLNLTTRKQGVLVTSGETASIFSKIFKKVASVLIRESEF